MLYYGKVFGVHERSWCLVTYAMFELSFESLVENLSNDRF